MYAKRKIVLVPFYRGAVVFYDELKTNLEYIEFSSPFIEERLYLQHENLPHSNTRRFSSPFIEERLYLTSTLIGRQIVSVLVPFYRGAVVFYESYRNEMLGSWVLVPFYRGAVVFYDELKTNLEYIEFSSPFIEERLYFKILHDWF